MATLTRTGASVSRVFFFPSIPGSRAVYMTEAVTRKERRQIEELFDTVGDLAEVVPIASGRLMSYAVKVQGDAELLGKIEWLLKTQFSFTIMERSFSAVIFDLVKSLCDEAASELAEVPTCGICATPEPFPTRITVEFEGDAEKVHRCYCAHCYAAHAHVDPRRHALSLLRKDRRRLNLPASLPVVEMPEMLRDEAPAEHEPLLLAATG